MPVESVTYIDDFVATNPDGSTDAVSTLDNHIRNMKTGILNSFPNITGAMNATQGELNTLASVTAGTAAASKALVLDANRDIATIRNLTSDGTVQAATGTFTNLTKGGSGVLVSSDIGSSVQGYDADLAAIAALANTDSNFIVGNGSAWVAESGATARTSLGLGSIATQASSSVSITGGSIAGITDLAVADGGTGASTAEAARTNLGFSGAAGTVATANLENSAVTRAKLSTTTGSQTGSSSSTIDFLLSPYSYFPRVEAGGPGGTFTMQGLSYSGTGTADTPGFEINMGGGSAEYYAVYWRYVQA